MELKHQASKQSRVLRAYVNDTTPERHELIGHIEEVAGRCHAGDFGPPRQSLFKMFKMVSKSDHFVEDRPVLSQYETDTSKPGAL